MSKHNKLFILSIAIFSILSFSVSFNSQAAVSQASQWVTPLEMDFGPIGLGSTSPTMIVTITNSGNVPLTGWAGGTVPAPFNVTQDCVIPGGILPGKSCHYYFTFSPTAAGSYSATSSSITNAGPINITVYGTGVGAQATYDAHSLDFGDLYTDGITPVVAPPQIVTITNTGLAPLTDWAGGAVPAPFGASQDCVIPGGVLPGNSCHYYFSFSTNEAGSYSATSTSSTNGGAIIIDVDGAAHTDPNVSGGQQASPRALDFGPVGIGNTTQLTVTLTNNGLTNITGWAGGAVSAPFNGSQDCNIPGGLPPAESCHFFYTFAPSAAGSFSAVSNVTDSFGSFSINLQGVGLSPSVRVDYLWLDFGPVGLINRSRQIVTITNTGQTPLAGWAGGAVPDPFNGSQDCVIPGGVLPGNSCHFYYDFSPKAEGFYTATSTFSTNAGTFSVKLQGEGVQYSAFFLPVINK
jgi:hypothetical protein